jgi:uncharacterized membrane protein YoaK (UPF0700 family)
MSTNDLATGDRLSSGTALRDWLLFTLTVSSGAVDAISFVALGKVFTAFMTGNIAFLGLAIAQDPNAPSILAVLASMAGFAIGIDFATRIVTPSESPATNGDGYAPDAVWPRLTTYALGASLLAHLCFLLIWIAVDARPDANATLALLTVWALAMGMQSAAVRRLDVGGVFTTAATATFIFLVGDFARKPLTGEERRRLLGVLVSLAIGATMGSLLLIHAPIYAPLLSLGLTLAVIATAAAAFAHRDQG